MNMAIAPEDILIRMLPTPNPYALKFVLNQPVKRDGKATFKVQSKRTIFRWSGLCLGLLA